MNLLTASALGIYSFIDLIMVEILLAGVIRITPNGAVARQTTGRFISTWKGVAVFFIVGFGYFVLSNFWWQQDVVEWLVAQGYRSLWLGPASPAFAAFWFAKTVLDRKWSHKVVWVSGAVCVLFTALFGLSYVV